MLAKARRGARLGYLDFFCGPGHYEDGSESTPVIIMRQILADDRLKERMVTLFNDVNPDHVATLKARLEALPGYAELAHPPLYQSDPVDKAFADYFEETSIIPSYIFIDPFGYKAVSLKLIASVSKDWGCDVLMFFNYSRVNMAVNNPVLTHLLDDIFGEENSEMLRRKIKYGGLSADDRRKLIMTTLHNSITQEIAPESCHAVWYRFLTDKGRTSHYLFFFSKHPLGYSIMKEIMYNESQFTFDGVGNFMFDPRVTDDGQPRQPSLFPPLGKLEERLMRKYKNKSMTMGQIFREDHFDTFYVAKNYKDALNSLEEKGYISADPPAEKRQIRNGKRTFADRVKVVFHDTF